MSIYKSVCFGCVPTTFRGQRLYPTSGSFERYRRINSASFRLPKDGFSYCEIMFLLAGEIILDQSILSTVEVVNRIGQILADVDLSVWVRDFVDDFHDTATVRQYNDEVQGRTKAPLATNC